MRILTTLVAVLISSSALADDTTVVSFFSETPRVFQEGQKEDRVSTGFLATSYNRCVDYTVAHEKNSVVAGIVCSCIGDYVSKYMRLRMSDEQKLLINKKAATLCK